MDLIMTMFKPKSSMSPAKSIDTSQTLSKKRKHDQSPTRFVNGDSCGENSRPSKTQKTTDDHGSSSRKGSRKDKKQGFTFEEVKTMLDILLSKDKKLLDSNVKVGLKNIDLSDLTVPGHKTEECKELIDKLVRATRRIRTLEEVLQEVRSSLNRHHYTNIILQSSLRGEPPKRPVSAYLLFHQKRFKELQDEGETLASAIAKRVSEEWRELDDDERSIYTKQHDEELKAYEETIKKMGLGKAKKPTRPKSVKLMFVQSKMQERGSKLPKDKVKLAKLKQQFEDEFEKADPDIKEYWISIYNAEQQRYLAEKLKFVEDNPHLDRNDIIKTRPTKVKIKPPAAPRNALKIFVEKKIPEGLEGQELKDTEAKLREKFDKMSTKKQLKYIKKALKDKDRYDVELAEFVAEHPEFKVPHHKPNITKEQWRLYQSHVEHRPPIPAPTAYLHFCSNRIKSLDDPDQAPTKRLQDASNAWNKLSEREKNELHKEHIEHINQYIEGMEDWLGKQDEKRKEQLFREDPKSKPDYWRKRIIRLEKCNANSQKSNASKKSNSSSSDSD